ncbi:MAG: hypothetical protein N2645_14540 [Clostridia bacterium]|nr:hypothetical protein [Clostridia bacterium]
MKMSGKKLWFKALALSVSVILVLTTLMVTGIVSSGSAIPAWQPDTNYAKDDIVIYNSIAYQCVVAHKSLDGWQPPNVPALWSVFNGMLTPAPTPTTTSQGEFTISGYIKADVSSSNPSINTGFKIEVAGSNTSGSTDNNGYFQVKAAKGDISLKITKNNYLSREIKNISLNSNIAIGSKNSPVDLWAGDVAADGIQDDAINMSDIVQALNSFNTSSTDGKYNPDLDFDKDNAINMVDILIIINHFNKSTADYPVVIPEVLSTPTPTLSPSSTPTPTSNSTWGDKVFAPYAYTGSNISISKCFAESGQKYYTVAFVVSDANGNPVFDVGGSVASNFYGAEISKVKSSGGDVMISFGGYGSVELAQSNPDVATLQAKYQSVIDMYKVSWLDFDIEMSGSLDSTVVARRNLALKGLQDKNPGLKISYTLPVAKTGLLSNTLSLLNDAKAKGVKVESVDIMTFDFGDVNYNMGELAVNCAKATYEQIQKIDPNMKIGIITMINRDDHGSPFTTADAQIVLDFAQKTSWVRLLSFWQSASDANWSFTKLFKAYQ